MWTCINRIAVHWCGDIVDAFGRYRLLCFWRAGRLSWHSAFNQYQCNYMLGWSPIFYQFPYTVCPVWWYNRRFMKLGRHWGCCTPSNIYPQRTAKHFNMWTLARSIKMQDCAFLNGSLKLGAASRYETFSSVRRCIWHPEGWKITAQE